MSFESQVGDLASITKVEKRRAQTIEKVQEFEGKETALLIDRYKYMDLLPCSESELKAIGYLVGLFLSLSLSMCMSLSLSLFPLSFFYPLSAFTC